MELVLVYLVGVIFGYVMARGFLHSKKVGTLFKVDSNEPGEDPYLFLELSKDIHEIVKREYVTLQVKRKKSQN